MHSLSLIKMVCHLSNEVLILDTRSAKSREMTNKENVNQWEYSEAVTRSWT